jgi:hypothetical protein
MKETVKKRLVKCFEGNEIYNVNNFLEKHPQWIPIQISSSSTAYTPRLFVLFELAEDNS